MASPWNFFARLVSAGRERKREQGSTNEVKPDTLDIAGLTEAGARESLNSADRPTTGGIHRHDQAVAISAERMRSEEAASDAPDQVDREVPKIVEAADPALSDGLDVDLAAAHSVTDIDRAVEAAPRKQRSRRKKAVAILKVSHTDEISLDEEIRVLRGELARKLKLQNAQLRTMLERCERSNCRDATR
ncbi:hypothetical protein CO657_32520 (plasmid) [Rhizobium acidisoli]|uniref:Uncharacterized protein n=1 Tax=Rhizobium acidisoli TaxID=1538158 RepID=A0AAE5WU40_9HYPH|nr:hypothetical protein [Rhizobium acidisoli]KPH04292.1 hypothetical protein AOG23_34050 [Rhizobium acidisoli]QAS82553.1 hypothetical protein CO657_32520 [Rhizobium acidisoli]